MAQESCQSLERRPIRARELPVFQRLAGWLAARGVSANAISLAGVGFGILAGAALGSTSVAPPWARRAAFVLAAACIQLRLLANMLDGMVAVAGGRASPVGELYNEVPDRVSDAATLIGLGCAAGGSVLLGCLAALAAILTAYVRAAGKAAGARQEYCGPMAKQQRMFLVTVAALYCGLTPSSWQPAWGAGGQWGLAAAFLAVIFIAALATAARRLRRIAAQLRGTAA